MTKSWFFILFLQAIFAIHAELRSEEVYKVDENIADIQKCFEFLNESQERKSLETQTLNECYESHPANIALADEVEAFLLPCPYKSIEEAAALIIAPPYQPNAGEVESAFQCLDFLQTEPKSDCVLMPEARIAGGNLRMTFEKILPEESLVFSRGNINCLVKLAQARSDYFVLCSPLSVMSSLFCSIIAFTLPGDLFHVRKRTYQKACAT